MDSRQQPQLTDLADREWRARTRWPLRSSSRRRGSRWSARGRPWPWGADDVFAHRAHLVVVVGVFDQDVDLGEAEFDGDADAPGAVGDGEFAVLFGDGRRLEDADRLDARSQRRVGHVRLAGFCGGCRGSP